MRAVQLTRFGGPELLEPVELPTPTPGPGEVLVRVRGAGVNFAETLMRADRYALTPPLPSVLGFEVSGIVAQVGAEVMDLGIGDRVAAPLFASGRHFGGYAEYALIDAAYAVPLPDGLSFEHATALMAQGLTALHLTRQAPPQGKAVLVNAAAGGVGSLLVQLAKRAGAAMVIAGASSTGKLAMAEALGADLGVDYTRPGWVEAVHAATRGAGPDIVYESVGGAVTMECLAALAPRGQLVIYGALNIQDFQLGVPELLGLIFKNQSVTGFALVPLLRPETVRMGLASLFELAADGALQVHIGGIYPLESAADAHRAMEERGTTGKLVLVP